MQVFYCNRLFDSNISFLMRFQLTVLNFPFSDSFRYGQIDIQILINWKQQKRLKLDEPFPFQNSFIKRQNLSHKSTFSQSFFLYFYAFDVWWHQITFSKKKVTALTFLIWLRRRTGGRLTKIHLIEIVFFHLIKSFN